MQGGSGSSGSTGGSSGTRTPAQQEYYDQLLSGASDWLTGGGLEGGNEYLGQMEDTLGGLSTFYQDILGGTVDQEMLNSQLAMQQSASQEGLDSSLSGVSESANMSGSAGGSKQGIAEGMAVSDANSSLQDSQTKLINDAYQQEQARKMGAAQGMGNVAQGYMGVQDAYQSESEQALASLGAFKNLISGDMGGTTDSTNWQNTKQDNIGWQLSDKTMKKFITDTGEDATVKATGDTVPIKEYEYTAEAKEDFGAPSGKQRGVLAQDVEKFDPEAVQKKKKKKRVNYGALDMGEG